MLPIKNVRRIAAILLGAVLLYGCSRPATLDNIHGRDLTGAEFARTFSLNGTDGARHTLADFRDKIVLVFFGFTQCPDICPTALVRAANVKKLLGKDGQRLQVLFITVDPERDNPPLLGNYVSAFDPSFLGLYGSLEETRQTAKEFKVYYKKIPTGSSYTMDHTALTYLYDTKGRLRIALSHSQSDEDYVQDIRQLLALD
ncbi:SCO family protein [Advenella sp. S44]|uniref:SCO family protein n=1 Tax=Advenella sp. S44 TaxID=1982755 RepID=UPI000C2B0B24|nr:SCO family protein [Advenella sp. S44]PJX25803.1 SCO family protein [Advenella sp. S44]